jgi:hypothetical protein
LERLSLLDIFRIVINEHIGKPVIIAVVPKQNLYNSMEEAEQTHKSNQEDREEKLVGEILHW